MFTMTVEAKIIFGNLSPTNSVSSVCEEKVFQGSEL